MKKGNILNITTKYNEKEALLCCYAGDDNGKHQFLLANGRTTTFSPEQIVTAKAVRGLPAEARTLFKKRLDAHEKIEKLKKEIYKKQCEITEISNSFADFNEQMTHARGLITEAEFAAEFENNLSDSVKNEMRIYGYSVDTPTHIPYYPGNIHISRNVDIQKYFRHGSFVYEEYDGTIHLRGDCEKNKEYKEYIHRYSKPLSVKEKIYEVLGLGDKDWLSYHATYEITVKKPLTKEYAKELAKEFCK